MALIHLTDVYLCPSVSNSLISLSQICKKRKDLHFKIDSNSTSLMQGDKVIFKGFRHDDLYYLTIFSVENASCNNSEQCLNVNKIDSLASNKFELWHHKLGHLNPEYIRRMVKNNMVINLDLKESDIPKDFSCKTCFESKSSNCPIDQVLL